jgi:hypothetical protein
MVQNKLRKDVNALTIENEKISANVSQLHLQVNEYVCVCVCVLLF